MVELSIKVEMPAELKEEIEESGLDLSKLAKEIIIAKIFEIQLSKSKSLQRALFEALIIKSKLSEEEAIELADKINQGMLKDIKKELPEL